MDFQSIINNKIYEINELKKVINSWRLKNDKIVFTNGCFDILHLGHIHILSKSRTFGHKLIVGLNSNKSIKKLNKGKNRPINDEKSRAIILSSLIFVDAVVIFDEETPLNIIKLIRPDVLIKGGDYKINEIVGADFVLQNGGKVYTVDLLNGYSTSIIERKIKNG